MYQQKRGNNDATRKNKIIDISTNISATNETRQLEGVWNVHCPSDQQVRY